MNSDFIFFVLVSVLLSQSQAKFPRSGIQEKRIEILSDDYTVEWQANFDEETIEFTTTVKTTGFVGFGLSLSGKMSGADIFVAGVGPEGNPYFKDYHGPPPPLDNGFPIEDAVQDWELLEGSENGETRTTILKFKRKLDTCDPNNDDVAITAGTVKIIWAIGETDALSYHTADPSKRGALAVNMLDPPLPPLDLSKFDTTNFTKSVTLTSDKDTIYWCTMFKRTSTQKSHIVAFKPKFDTPEAYQYSHHFNMYTCKAPEGVDPVEFFDRFTGDQHPGQDCFKNVPDGLPRGYCQSNLYAWSLGGRALVFPDDIGFPWGEDDTEYFLFEVHLNNPEKLGGVTFETGVTIYDTTVLREKEAGMMSIGHATGTSLILPPNSKGWKVVGHCSADCTDSSLEQEGINIFNINLHAHLAGRKMRVRHFRQGTELPWISNDISYDADFQENRPLVENINVKPGDHISMECTFDSTKAVIGGYATSDEMCMLFAFYYPKAPMEFCFSGYPEQSVYELLGIESVEPPYEGSLDPIVVLPEKWKGLLYSQVLDQEIEWTDELRTTLQNNLLRGNHFDYCRTNISSDPSETIFGVGKSVIQSDFFRDSYPWVTYPVVDKEYEEPDLCADDETETPPVTPVTDNPTEETPVTDNPTEETPVTDNPTEETPVTDNPTKETPVTDNPTEETPKPSPGSADSTKYLNGFITLFVTFFSISMNLH